MRFIAAIVGAASFVGIASASDCDNGPWAPVSVTGFDGGNQWCDTQWKSGLVITGVEVWSDGDIVNAIKFRYSDGRWSDPRGRRTGKQTSH